MSEACAKNPKKFLWWSWLGDHDWAYINQYTTQWGDRSYGKFVDTAERTCRLCGLQQKAEYRIIEFASDWKPELTGKWIPPETPDGLYLHEHPEGSEDGTKGDV